MSSHSFDHAAIVYARTGTQIAWGAAAAAIDGADLEEGWGSPEAQRADMRSALARVRANWEGKGHVRDNAVEVLQMLGVTCLLLDREEIAGIGDLVDETLSGNALGLAGFYR